ncbi:actin-related protein 2/3 complex subunit 5 family protein [Aspergillus novofumigatus IBT 16806]|uniref:Actin-related protein 2/3 complex subunit 5 n=1 Tax=Aspergillus novofumigatus (strain IBT 16806) TaxID=1392255 RepID=A0A2I1C3D1_ASPN1|nr:putative Arp2/3 complex subunit Arc16 [Aspergillus novofumigatus IBT 16806]PKX92091.1 putative Arp2/3 complex subunit Arc16 [Aspergillus novofumigatus IBT 16806]
MAQLNYRTINIDVLDPESSVNFPMETLLPATLPPPQTSSDAANVASQVRQLLRGGDPEGALRYVLDTAPLGGDDRAKEVHMATVVDVLQGIRQGEMTRVLEGYKGMAAPAPGGGAQSPRKSVSPQNTGFSQIQARNLGEGGSAQQMSVLLSWHERLVELTGTGSIVRVMTDRRTV